MKEKTLLFRILIVLDFMLNVLTRGGFQTCFSTRCYINAQRVKPLHKRAYWVKIMYIVDKIMCEKDHCLKSYAWELNGKYLWIKENTL